MTLQTPPILQLSFYPYGVLLRRQTENGGCVEYAVDPAQVATLLAGKMRFETGLLTSNTLYIAQIGIRHIVAEYRPPQKTAVYLEGSAQPLRVPFPGLVMIRATTGGQGPRYGVFAVKGHPSSLDIALYHPPLPNIYGDGAVCWGSVNRASANSLAGNDLTEDWTLLLGSAFGNHGVGGKSRQYPLDIREQLMAVEKRRSRVYPVRDLVKQRFTLGNVLAEMRGGE